MTIQDLINHFGNLNKLSVFLGYDRARVYHWKSINKIPLLQQFIIEDLTDGALKANKTQIKRR